MDSRNNEGNLVSPEDAFRVPINKAQLKACFPSMSWAAWERGQCNIPKHCTDEWMRSNWEIYRGRARCSREKRNKDEVGLRFLTLLWHTRNGMNIDWESFDMSVGGRTPLPHSAKRPRNDGNENLNENELEFATSLSAQGPSSDGEQPTELCSECQARHMKEINELEAKLKASKLDLDREKKLYETKVEILKKDLPNLKAHYERLSAKLPLDDNNGNLIEFLKVRRDCNRSDVIITVAESQIFAHSIILASRSLVFEKLLQCDSSETQTNKRAPINLHVDGLSSPVVEAIIDFCYTGEIDFSESVPPPEVLKGATEFQLAFLSKLTEAELCRELVVDNVPQMLKLSRLYSAARLQEEASKLFKENFDILRSRVYEVMEGPSHRLESGRTSERRDSESKLHGNPSETRTIKGNNSAQRAELPSAVKENNLEGNFGDGKAPSKLPRNLGPNRTRSPTVPFGPRSVNIDEDQIPQQPAHRPTQSSVRVPPSKPASEGDTQPRKIEVADADFHDFEKYRTEQDFVPGQIWAIYDDQDGMPRFYGRISRVSTKPFRAHMNWVNHCHPSHKEVAWTHSTGFSIACGLFSVACTTTVVDQIDTFSHTVMELKSENGMLKIYPKTGQVWAVHRDWDAAQSTRSERVAGSNGRHQHTYDMVEILSEFSEENGVKAAFLSRISGFRTVFMRQGMQAVRHFKPTELMKFSHSVPNKRFYDVEANSWGIPRGALELDPASVDDLTMGNENF